METISWTDSVKNETVRTVKEYRNIVHNNKKKANWIGYILCRNCLLIDVIEGKVEERTELMERPEIRRKQLLDDSKESTRYWKLKQEALDRTVLGTMWKRLQTCFKRDYGMNEHTIE
jgi:AAA+ ATPase superfamily predicted ATPase